MQEQNKNEQMKLGRFIGMSIGITLIISIMMGVILSIGSNFEFVDVAVFVFVAILAIIVPVIAWSYAIEPFWWDELSSDTQQKIQTWGVASLVVIVMILVPSGMVGGSNWSGEGLVNLFPKDEPTKNYRVPADIEVETKFWWKEVYSIESVTWPNEGSSTLTDCVIGASNNICTDESGRSWRIEIEQTPDRPSYDG